MVQVMWVGCVCGGGGGVGVHRTGNLPYLVANTYGLSFIKYGGI